MFTIKTKIIAAYTALFGIMLIVFSIIVYNSNKQAAFGKLDTDLKSYSLALQTELIEQLNENNHLNMKELTAIRPEGLSRAKFQIYTPSHIELISDDFFSNGNPDKAITLSDGESKFLTFRHKHKRYRSFISTFETQDDSVYILEAAASMKDAYESVDRLYFLFLILIPIGLVITGFAAYLISKSAFKPITGMISTAKEISGKNLSRRLQVPEANDEIRLLGETLNEMMERINKAFESQRQFTANASHEIKTPLTVIQSELEIAERKSDNEEVNKGIRAVLSEIESLTALTNSLLTLARLDSMQLKLNKEIIRIDELLVESVQFMKQPAAAKKINLNLSISESCEINADKEKMKSVFINLLDNAIKYSPAGSTVKIGLHKKGNYVTAFVSDEGPGMPQNTINQIFNRFYRSDETRGKISGSGLGLSIVHEFVEMHGGRIEVFSEPGKGARFEVILPAS